MNHHLAHLGLVLVHPIPLFMYMLPKMIIRLIIMVRHGQRL